MNQLLSLPGVLESTPVDDFLNLFSRLVGCYTISGRVKAMPREGAAFVARVFQAGTQPLAVEAHRCLPSRLAAPMQKRVKSGKLSGSVGYVGVGPLMKWLPAGLYKAAGVKDPQLKAAVEGILKNLARPSSSLLRAAGLDPSATVCCLLALTDENRSTVLFPGVTRQDAS